jgi:hypothetical protein
MPASRHGIQISQESTVRPQILIVLVVAIVCAAVGVVAMVSFEPLPLFAGLIAAGAWRSWRVSRETPASKAV